jgi:hypothetical protein
MININYYAGPALGLHESRRNRATMIVIVLHNTVDGTLVSDAYITSLKYCGKQ